MQRARAVDNFFGYDITSTAQEECMALVKAPFSSAQVKSLNAWQKLGYVHEFTCGVSSSHPPLVATKKGWHCARFDCTYTQDWAHDFMADKKLHPPAPFSKKD